MEGTTQHEYAQIVDLTTQNALKSMLGPTLLTIPVSIVLGFMFVPCPWQLSNQCHCVISNPVWHSVKQK